MRRRHVVALLVLMVFGLAKMPFEAQLEATRKGAYFNKAKFTLSLRQQLGQMSFLAAVGGFRALVADYCYLDAYAQWQRVEWGRVKLSLDAATSLQPRQVFFWEQAGWHMAYNASVAAINDKKEPRLALRLKAQQEFFRLGEDYFIRGIANNPERWELYKELGRIYVEKFKEPCKAADIYDRGAQLPDAPEYLKRFAAYELAKCPGHEREAYERLRKYYLMGEQEHLPTLLKTLRNLQEKLDIPPGEKIAIPPDPKP
jgi:hypothetical protein